MEPKQEGGAYLMIDENKKDGFKLDKVTNKIKETQKSTGYPYTFEIAEPKNDSSEKSEEKKPTKKEESKNTYINGVMTMLLNAIEVKCMSYKSLKGFIFIVEVAKEEAKEEANNIKPTVISFAKKSVNGLLNKDLEFFTASRRCIDISDSECIDKTNTNKPISKFLLKLTFLQNNENGSLSLIDLSEKLSHIGNISKLDTFDDPLVNKITKQKDYIKDFKNEAKIQQKLFETTYLDDPVTFGLLASCHIEDDTMYFLHLLRSKANDSLTYQVLQAMIDSWDCKCPIGLIAMEYGNGYEPISQHIIPKTNEKYNDQRKVKLYANIFFKILLMLGILKKQTDKENERYMILHMDLHQNNIMAFKNIVNNGSIIKKSYNIFPCCDGGTNTYKYNTTTIEFKPFTYIIDFGRIIKINSANENDRKYKSAFDSLIKINFDYFDDKNKNRLHHITETYSNIVNILNIILKTELSYYNDNFKIQNVQSLFMYKFFLSDTIKDADIYRHINNGSLQYNDKFYKENKKGDPESNTFCAYVNDLIYYYLKITSSESSDIGTVKPDLYDGATYNLKKVDLDPSLVRIKDQYGIILYDKKPEHGRLNHSDLTTYSQLSHRFNSDFNVEYNEIIKDKSDEQILKLIRDIRKSILNGDKIDSLLEGFIIDIGQKSNEAIKIEEKSLIKEEPENKPEKENTITPITPNCSSCTTKESCPLKNVLAICWLNSSLQLLHQMNFLNSLTKIVLNDKGIINLKEWLTHMNQDKKELLTDINTTNGKELTEIIEFQIDKSHDKSPIGSFQDASEFIQKLIDYINIKYKNINFLKIFKIIEKNCDNESKYKYLKEELFMINLVENTNTFDIIEENTNVDRCNNNSLIINNTYYITEENQYILINYTIDPSNPNTIEKNTISIKKVKDKDIFDKLSGSNKPVDDESVDKIVFDSTKIDYNLIGCIIRLGQHYVYYIIENNEVVYIVDDQIIVNIKNESINDEILENKSDFLYNNAPKDKGEKYQYYYSYFRRRGIAEANYNNFKTIIDNYLNQNVLQNATVCLYSPNKN